ncbi:solute carrier family 15 member 4-like [Watersipora subatra]|uniref:solute carrier family 15 member 4-like n=1 Tax=Watersipora subatra TaxID=2589382 RepID=UPI00355B38C0
MGNLASIYQALIRRRVSTHESLRQSDDDLSVVNRNGVGVSEFFSVRKQRIALGAMLVCQLFDWVVFTIVTTWIPLSMQLNIFFINIEGVNDDGKYEDYMRRVQLISILSLVILYSSAWIAGILMDAWWRKTIFVLVSFFFVAVGCGYLSAMVVTVGNGINCTNPLNASYDCNLKSFALCLTKEPNGNSCLTVYTAWVCFISAMGAVIRTALPALGGDQIPNRNGVRVFYAQFYWCQKAGETISAVLCLIYLCSWKSYITKAEKEDPSINSFKNTYNFLFDGWASAIAGACFLSLLAVCIVAFGKLTRQVSPDFGVVKDTCLIWLQAIKRRKHRDEDGNFLDPAKRSKGGSYADQAVEDRRNMMKFSLVLLLLVPVAFATTIPTLPRILKQSEDSLEDWLQKNQQEIFTTVLTYLVMYVTSCLAIPIIHWLCSIMSGKGRPLTLLHRLVLGHIFMILALLTDTIMNKIVEKHIMPCTTTSTFSYFRKACRYTQMAFLGICNAFIYTTGYELTMLSAPRAMQGAAMGLFYLMDGAANMINLAIITNTDITFYMYDSGSLKSLNFRFIIDLAGMCPLPIALILLILSEKKYNLGLSRV